MIRDATSARIDLVLQDGFFASGLHVTIDALAVARTIGDAVGQPFDTRFAIRTVDGRPATSSSGVAVAPDGAWDEGSGDHVLAFGVGMADEDRIESGLGTPTGRALVAHLAAAHGRGAEVGASCSSTFYLAESGLLDGGEAVTSWWLASFFRSRYPAVTLRPDAGLVQYGRVMTAGAALAQLDLALHLVGRIGGLELSHTVARYLVIDRAAGSFGPHLIAGHLTRNDALVARAERLLRARMRDGIEVEPLARVLGVSPRTLSRRFLAATGFSPSGYLRRARAEEASRLLLTTDRSVGEVATAVGYSDDGALRRAFTDLFGESPRAWRRRHRRPR